MDTYKNFDELRENEREGDAFEITVRIRASMIAIVAPHGGGIEGGTTEVAHSIAGDEFGFYDFYGKKKEENGTLHITSVNFDEPRALKLVKSSHTVLAIHGCQGNEAIVYLGGLDESLKERIRRELDDSGFQVGFDPTKSATNAKNICNQGITGLGVQLEISKGLRLELFEGLDRHGRTRQKEKFPIFVQAIRRALLT